MRFESYIGKCMAKLTEQTVQGQPAAGQPAQPAQAPAAPATPAAPAAPATPPAQPDPQADAALKARKEALKKKLAAKIDSLTDANAISELEKIQ